MLLIISETSFEWLLCFGYNKYFLFQLQEKIIFLTLTCAYGHTLEKHFKFLLRMIFVLVDINSDMLVEFGVGIMDMGKDY